MAGETARIRAPRMVETGILGRSALVASTMRVDPERVNLGFDPTYQAFRARRGSNESVTPLPDGWTWNDAPLRA